MSSSSQRRSKETNLSDSPCCNSTLNTCGLPVQFHYLVRWATDLVVHHPNLIQQLISKSFSYEGSSHAYVTIHVLLNQTLQGLTISRLTLIYNIITLMRTQVFPRWSEVDDASSLDNLGKQGCDSTSIGIGQLFKTKFCGSRIFPLSKQGYFRA